MAMVSSFIRRVIASPYFTNPLLLSRLCNFCSKPFLIPEPESRFKPSSMSDHPTNGSSDQTFSSFNNLNTIHLSPLLSTGSPNLEGFKIELVDSDLWQVSNGLSHAWRISDRANEARDSSEKLVSRENNLFPNAEYYPDFDVIEDMRFHGNLFYKLDRDSKEFEEYNIRFRGKRSSQKKEERETQTKLGKEKAKQGISSELVTPKQHSRIEEISEGKRLRNPTYNQQTGPYHQPFCLDIYISKSSVRACIVHRVTSKVVVVAHSISKDMKHDLVSTKDCKACAAVGAVLAERSIADDIHNVVYTPRKGERIEGKLEIVLQSVIDHGVDVKVKIKQRKPMKLEPSASPCFTR